MNFTTFNRHKRNFAVIKKQKKKILSWEDNNFVKMALLLHYIKEMCTYLFTYDVCLLKE